jgi:hypothetical protein
MLEQVACIGKVNEGVVAGVPGDNPQVQCDQSCGYEDNKKWKRPSKKSLIHEVSLKEIPVQRSINGLHPIIATKLVSMEEDREDWRGANGDAGGTRGGS